LQSGAGETLVKDSALSVSHLGDALNGDIRLGVIVTQVQAFSSHLKMLFKAYKCVLRNKS